MHNEPSNPVRSPQKPHRLIRLRRTTTSDLPTLFNFQLDPEANRLAAMHPRSVSDFYAHWEQVLSDPAVVARTILAGDAVAGSISSFQIDGRDHVGYWIGREYWGQGVATAALEKLLELVATRPLHAQVAVENVASIRVLQKCGFVIIGYRHSPADGRYRECQEAQLELPDDSTT